MFKRPRFYLDPDRRELIGRAALVALSLLCATVAIALLVLWFRLLLGMGELGAGDPRPLNFLLLIPALFFAVMSVTFFCFVFAARNKKASRPVRVLAISNYIRELFEGMLGI